MIMIDDNYYEYDLRTLLPYSLRDDESFDKFMKVINPVVNDIKYYVDYFNEIMDPDTVPFLFVPKIVSMLGFDYVPKEDQMYFREIIKRIINIYKHKGNDSDIINAANNSLCDGWLGDKYFLPSYEEYNNHASISYPIDEVFTHNVSKHSETHKFLDNYEWMYGVIVVSVDDYDDRTEKAILSVLPAGIRCIIRKYSGMFPITGDLYLGYHGVESWMHLFTTSYVSMKMIGDTGFIDRNALIHSVGGNIHSGKFLDSSKYRLMMDLLGDYSYIFNPIGPIDSYLLKPVEINPAAFDYECLTSVFGTTDYTNVGVLNTRISSNYRSPSSVRSILEYKPDEVGVTIYDGFEIQSGLEYDGSIMGENEYDVLYDGDHDDPDTLVDGSSGEDGVINPSSTDLYMDNSSVSNTIDLDGNSEVEED